MKIVAKLDPKWHEIMRQLGPDVLQRRIENARDQTLSQASAASLEAIEAQFGSRKLAPNAQLTIGIKQHDHPLIDTKGVLQSLTAIQPKPEVVWVGVPRTAGRSRHWIKALSAFDAAVQIHNGKSIRVTDKMRWLFQMLYMARIGRISASDLTGRAAELYSRGPVDWRPLSKSKKVIRTPKRPFLSWALNRSGLKRKCRRIFREAVRRHLDPSINPPTVQRAVRGKP